MFAPKLYTVYKIPLRDVVAANYDIEKSRGEMSVYKIKQQDSMLLRQLRLITGDTRRFNPYIVFVSIDNKDENVIREVVYNGIVINGRRFLLSERSASMTRIGILSFVDAEVFDELEKRINMELTFDKTVLSKLYAYRGLLLSACHMLEGWFPKTIVVPDLMRTISNQHIKYATDVTSLFIDKDGNEREWTQKDIAEGYRDIQINVFDGCGIIHPTLCRQIEQIIGSKTRISSFIVRLPWCKGMLHELDYEQFLGDREIYSIKDIWGVEHDFSEPMIILTESQYKGYKMFKHYGDYRDWEHFWEMIHKYDHCWGIAKWNFTEQEEPVYTRANYQILQDLFCSCTAN